MKRIDAVIKKESFAAVKKGLEDAACPGMIVSMIRGFGRQGGLWDEHNGRRFKLELLPKVLLTIFVSDEDASRIVEVIRKQAYTGQIGDGKIFISGVENAIRVRTAEEGEAALT